MIETEKFFNLKWLVVAVTFTAIIILLTHLPQEVLSEQLKAIEVSDIYKHIVAYGVITFLFLLSFRNSLSLIQTLLLFLTISAVATLDELTQPFVNRIASPIDWLADIIGIIIPLLIFLYFSRTKNQAVINTDL